MFIKQLATYFSFSLALTTANVLSVSVSLPFLDTSYKWNHTTSHLWGLASLTWPHVFKIHPYYSNVSVLHSF